MLKSILKPLMMLFRNAVMWAVLFAWLFKDITGAGRVFAFYVVMSAALTLIYAFMPMKPEKVLNITLLNTFWRWVELTSQWAMLGVVVWFGHIFVAIAWGVACSCLAIMRLRIQTEKKKALEAQAKEIVTAFTTMMRGYEHAPDATMADVGLQP